MRKSRKSTSGTRTGKERKEVSVAKIGLVSAVIVAIIGLIGSVLDAYFSSQAVQAPLLIPIQATQTAEARSMARTAGANPTSAFPAASPNRPSPTPPGFPTPTAQPTACPASMDFGELIQCEMAFAGEIRTITFNATQDEYIYLRLLDKRPGEMFSPRMTIYDPSDNKISEDYGKGGAERVIRLPILGTYTIRVEDGTHTYTGSFALYLQRLRDPVSVQIIKGGEQLRGSFTAAYQQNAYSFEAGEGEKVSISVLETPTNGPLTLRIIVYNSKGIMEFSGVDSSGILVTFPAPDSDIYIMFVSNSTFDSIGEYFVFRQ